MHVRYAFQNLAHVDTTGAAVVGVFVLLTPARAKPPRNGPVGEVDTCFEGSSQFQRSTDMQRRVHHAQRHMRNRQFEDAIRHNETQCC